MKPPKNSIILLLAATTVGGAVVAWRQHGELTELRAGAMKRSERADLQKRVWDLEKLNRELRDQLATRRPGETPSREFGEAGGGRKDREAGLPAIAPGSRFDPQRESERQFNAVRDVIGKPEVQAMIALQQKGAIEARYAALFKNLNLAPEQIEKLKTLLVERATTKQDIMAVALEQGINPGENPGAFRKLMVDAQNEINQSIQSVIGAQGLAQLTRYEQTLPQRNLVSELQQRLSYTSAPLTSGQAEQLVQILAANPPPRQPNPPGNP